MKHLKYLYLAAGAAMFAALLAAFDLRQSLALVWQAGALGVLGLCLAYCVAFSTDVLVWMQCLPALGRSLAWFARLTRVRLVGEAYNLVMPAGGFGGEPVKAVLLKQRYGLGYRDSTTGIALHRILGMAAQFVFVALAAIVMAAAVNLGPGLEAAVWIGIAIHAAMTAAFVLLPKLRVSSRLGRWLDRRSWARGMAHALAAVEDVEHRVGAFGRAHRGLYRAGFALALLRWFAGTLEMWLALRLVGYPIDLSEAFVLEGILQLARSVSFFIPANLGAQDGALALAVAALTGSPAAGLGVALLRRIRELLFIAFGFAVGGWYSLRRDAVPAMTASPNETEREKTR